jgi:Putative zinc- or iron-chelating domain
MMLERRNVPCGSCRRCCQLDLIVLHPDKGDVIANYETDFRTHPITGQMVHTLKHKANGECIYLRAEGCSIHGRAPMTCQEFDCRLMYLVTTRAQRRRLDSQGAFPKEVFDEGRKRVDTLSAQDRQKYAR